MPTENQAPIVVHLVKAFNSCKDKTWNITRYNGGWTKAVKGLNKKFDDGYSLVGEFVNTSDRLANQVPGLYLDCDIQGSRKNQDKLYQVFELRADGTASFIASSHGKSWAIELWPAIDAYFNAQQSAEGRKAEIVAEISQLEMRLSELKTQLQNL